MMRSKFKRKVATVLLSSPPSRIPHRMGKEIFHTVSDSEHGLRLDALIARIGEYSFRAAKRTIAEGNVLVNGRTRAPHYKVAAGACVMVRQTAPDQRFPPLELAAANSDYVAFIKPAGLHTAHIVESTSPSLEKSISRQWADCRTAGRLLPDYAIPDFLLPLLPQCVTNTPFPLASLPEAPPRLLSRLDAATSGIVPAATSATAAERFKALETAGQIRKYYLTVVHGIPEKDFVIQNALNMDTRKKTRVLAKVSPDETRHTEVFPLKSPPYTSIPGIGEHVSFALVRIRRGARHQIRAHLAHAGFPLLGDTLYGPDPEDADLHLHHACLAMPDFFAFCLPAWL